MSHADFDQSVAPITSYAQGGGGGSYTVQAGDALSFIAQTLWSATSVLSVPLYSLALSFRQFDQFCYATQVIYPAGPCNPGGGTALASGSTPRRSSSERMIGVTVNPCNRIDSSTTSPTMPQSRSAPAIDI